MKKRVIMIVEDNYEDQEVDSPLAFLQEKGFQVDLVGLKKNKNLKGKKGASKIVTTHAISDVRAEDYDGLIIPGGWAPDKLRIIDGVLDFVRAMEGDQKPIAAICHGPQVLINAEVVKGKRLTAYRAIWKDLENAGAEVLNKPVVVDGNLITSRHPGDLKYFNRAFLGALERG